MFKKTMTYTDWNGVERTEDIYFNLSKAELLEMQLTTEGGIDNMIQRMVQAKDTVSLVKLYKELILKAYGRKSADGRRFEKSEEISREFTETSMFSDFYMELATNDKAASDFLTGIMPKDLEAEVKKAMNNPNQLGLVGNESN